MQGLKDKKVMIVDDDTEFLEELKEILVSNGYYTIAINDSTTVLDAVKTQRPDLILLDLKMNGMNGFELADSLKRMGATALIPIIGISGIIRMENYFEHNYFLKDFCHMFDKPFNPLELIDKIEEILCEERTSYKKNEETLKRDILPTCFKSNYKNEI
ncbi:MAG: response regulator [bacterium]